MNPSRFFIPRFTSAINPVSMSNYLPTSNGLGLFGRVTSSMKNINWGGLLNGANRTLNVVNQAIPLVKQAGPMVNNMKSMFKIAKIFGNETFNGTVSKNTKTNQLSSSNVLNNRISKSMDNKNFESNYPKFFV